MRIRETDRLTTISVLIIFTYLIPIICSAVVIGKNVFTGRSPEQNLVVVLPFLILWLSLCTLQSYRGLVLRNILLLRSGSPVLSPKRGPISARLKNHQAYLLGILWFLLEIGSAFNILYVLFPGISLWLRNFFS